MELLGTTLLLASNLAAGIPIGMPIGIPIGMAIGRGSAENGLKQKLQAAVDANRVTVLGPEGKPVSMDELFELLKEAVPEKKN